MPSDEGGELSLELGGVLSLELGDILSLGLGRVLSLEPGRVLSLELGREPSRGRLFATSSNSESKSALCGEVWGEAQVELSLELARRDGG